MLSPHRGGASSTSSSDRAISLICLISNMERTDWWPNCPALPIGSLSGRLHAGSAYQRHGRYLRFESMQSGSVREVVLKNWPMLRDVDWSVLSLFFLPGCGSSNSGSGSQPTPPPPGFSSFAHVVVIIQENRTPDNLFQSMVASGADISPNGICHVGTAPCAGADSNGVLSLSPTPLAITYDLGHNYNAWTIDFHAGALDHFNGGGCSGGPCPTNAPYHYMQASDIQPYIQLAQTYAFADRMFQSNKGPSLPGHLYLSWGTSRLGSGSTVLGASNSAGYCPFHLLPWGRGRHSINKAGQPARAPLAWNLPNSLPTSSRPNS